MKYNKNDLENICIKYNDCKICPLALHKDLLSTIKTICSQNLSKEKIEYLIEYEDYYK